MSKEQESKLLKTQACVLKVNICCDGCQKKVKKLLQKIEGVYNTTIDAEERKVTVTGNVDPAVLITKLRKAGKHARLWSAKAGNHHTLTDQLELAKAQQQKEYWKTQKKCQQPQQQAKGFKDLKFPNLKGLKLPFRKGNRTVKFDLPPKEDVDDGSEYSDHDYDEFEDDDGLDDMDGFEEDVRGKVLGKDTKGAAGGGGGGGGRKGGVQAQNKAMGGSNVNGGGSHSQGGGGKNVHGARDSKHEGKHNKGGNGNPPQGGKKGGGGGSNDGVGGDGQLNMMGQMAHIPAVRRPSAGGGMPGYFQGGNVPPEMMMAGTNPYHQQQQQRMMMMMMLMNGQDRAAFPPPVGYGYGYGRPVYALPPPPTQPQAEPYTMFSDENPNSCSVM
ncbi:unnamed protein product [Musa acuminata subsp. malaccensis]|uniref:(wild Malaysian banana) hypothetical protein n=1 Tax=Musa acuminata subsp. malaccensis TaxID=214687 RepID=A0A804K498_MUSAM|nr:PREDICTED: serine, glycine and glutamine-rich protein-like [Musa acuminata subsp. malaccensis]CAG1830939.1 unnamed protein product [Musa acuminata subsp. malaccensis]